METHDTVIEALLAAGRHAAGELVIAPARPRFTLERLLAGITDENRHDAVETGEAVGDEVW